MNSDSLGRNIVAFTSSFLFSYGATAITLTLLSTFLWWWLAALLAMLVGVTAGVVGGYVCATVGYDYAVQGIDAACGFFSRVFA